MSVRRHEPMVYVRFYIYVDRKNLHIIITGKKIDNCLEDW